MAGAAIFEEIDAAVEIGADGGAQLLRRHVHQFLAHALGQQVVPLFLEQGQVAIAGQRIGQRKWPTPTQYIARHQHARADRLAAGDPVAHRQQRRQHAIAVTHGGDARAQLALGKFERQFLVPVGIAR